jgi:predicted phosphodiesterase
MKRYRKFLVVSDNHGDGEDQGAVRALREFTTFWKPTVRVHLGDCFDFRFLRKKADEQERRHPVQDDLDAGIDFLRTFKPTHFLRGNHDERLWDAARSDDGKLADFAARLILDIQDVLGDAIMLPYDKRKGVLRLGHLKVIHGYNAGVTAARIAAQIYGSVLMGHIHAVDQYAIPGIERRIGRAIGCLCKLDMEYNRAMAQTLRHSHGWAYGLLFDSGEYVVWQAEQVGGAWFFPSEIKEVKHNEVRDEERLGRVA